MNKLLVALVLGIIGTSTVAFAVSDSYGENGRIAVTYINYDPLLKSLPDPYGFSLYGETHTLYSHNLLTTIGSVYIAQMMNGTTSNWAWTNMTLGGNTSALAIGDTDLANIYTANGLSPATGTLAVVSNGNNSLTYTWTSSGASTYNVNTTGIYNTTGAGGKLIAEAYFGSNVALNGANGDKLTLTYYRSVN